MLGFHRVTRHCLAGKVAVVAGWGLLTFLSASAAQAGAGVAISSGAAPNIVMIVADDLGYSDIGAFGGEIDTPYLDSLAASGLKLTNFHAAPTCSPTRSMLLTGTDNHTAGVGAMAEALRPELESRYGYEGRITDRVATLAERLKVGGYATIMTGKWHLGMTEDSIPSNRGFDKNFALLQGGHNHFGQGGFGSAGGGGMGVTYLDDGKPATVPEDFYSSDYFTTRLIEKIAESDTDQPFFAYLAFTAPHSPLQAPAGLIEKYRGKYDEGWAVLRDQRLARMKALGLIAEDVVAHEMIPDAAAWDKLGADERRIEARKMEIYAAMVERLDWNVGRLINQLKADGRADNTVFLFISDNGAAGETAETFKVVPGAFEFISGFDNSFDNMGSATSFLFYGGYWAQAASAPFRQYKGLVTEGGTRVPAIVSGVGLGWRSGQGDAYGNVMDVVPTLLELAAVPATDQVAGRTVAPIRGRSMLAYLAGQAEAVYPADVSVPFELHGQRSVTRGPWKLVSIPAPAGSGGWQLFNLATDPGERIDVAAEHPEISQQLIADWESYASAAQVLME